MINLVLIIHLQSRKVLLGFANDSFVWSSSFQSSQVSSLWESVHRDFVSQHSLFDRPLQSKYLISFIFRLIFYNVSLLTERERGVLLNFRLAKELLFFKQSALVVKA